MEGDASAAVLEQRKKDYKKTISIEEARRSRTETTIQVRKQKQEARLAKRRMLNRRPAASGTGAGADGGMGMGSDAPASVAGSNLPTVPGARIPSSDVVADPNNMRKYAEMVRVRGDPSLNLEGALMLRKLVAVERNPPIRAVTQLGVLDILASFLRDGSNPRLQFESAWVLTNVASGSAQDTYAVIAAGATTAFMAGLESKYPDVQEQCVWALGNIAGDSPECRDMLLSEGVMRPLLGVFRNRSIPPAVLRNATWALSNLMRGKPMPPFHAVADGIPLLAELIKSEDNEVVTDACWAFSYVSDGENERVQRVVESGAVTRLVELMMSSKSGIVTPALRTIGNIVTGDDAQTDAVLSQNALPILLEKLSDTKRSIVKETCWTISNIAAGSVAQIDRLFEANIFQPLIEICRSAEHDLQREALWCICNVTAGGNQSQIMQLVDLGAVGPMCGLLNAHDRRMVTITLEGLENMLRVGKEAEDRGITRGGNKVVQFIEEAGGGQTIEDLQTTGSDEDIQHRAATLMGRYFDVEVAEDADDADDMDGVDGTNDDHFGFGGGGGMGGMGGDGMDGGFGGFGDFGED